MILAWMHGRNQIEGGVWFQRIQANDNLAQDQYGQASFSSLLSFMQGTIGTFTVVPSPTELGWRSLEAAGFVQDVIRLRPNVELRVGLRIDQYGKVRRVWLMDRESRLRLCCGK